MTEPLKGSYIGKVKNTGSQMVEAPLKMPSNKKPVTQKGGDLRAKRSAK